VERFQLPRRLGALDPGRWRRARSPGLAGGGAPRPGDPGVERSQLPDGPGGGGRSQRAVLRGLGGPAPPGTTQQDIYSRRISSTGALSDGAGLRLSRDTSSARSAEFDPDVFRVGGPSVAAAGSAFLVAFGYSDGTAGSADIGAFRIPAPGYAPQAFPVLTQAPGDQFAPSVAFNGRFLVTWIDRRNGKNDIWGTDVAANGTVQEPNGFLITEYYPENRDPVVTRARSLRDTFTMAWMSKPGGLEDGVVAYGVQFGEPG
jgi:hypothetical protein